MPIPRAAVLSTLPMLIDAPRRLGVLAAACAVWCAWPTLAWAQTTTGASIEINTPDSAPVLLEADGSLAGARKNNIDIKTFSLEDCINDRKVRFSLKITNDDPNRSVQSWVSQGPDCTDLNNRTSATVGQCWPGMQGNLPSNGVAVDAVFRLQDIAAQVKGTSFTPGTAASCEGLNSVPFTLFFMFVRGTQTEGSGTNTQLTFDTVGPNPPTGVSAGVGEQQVTVRWAVPTALTELAGFSVYCDDGSLSGSTVRPSSPVVDEEEEDTTEEETTDETSALALSTRQSADSTKLVAGELPSRDWKPCATVNNTTTSSLTVRQLSNGNKLEDGVPVAFAVSALDKFGNVGPLSTVVWATPKATVDFLDNYTAAGGAAEGCAAGSSSAVGPHSVLLVAAASLALGVCRRRARKDCSKT